MGSTVGVTMSTYESRLEKVLEQVLPYYYRYFEVTGHKPLPLDPLVVKKVLSSKLPVLLQKRP